MLTLSELAHLYRHDEDLLPDELEEKLLCHVLADPRYAGLIEQAESMARDAGVESPGFALFYHEHLDRLLNAEGWDDPAEVLQPDEEDTSCLGHRQMISILDARIARGEDRETLMPVKERLSPRSAAKMIEKTAAAMSEVPGSR